MAAAARLDLGPLWPNWRWGHLDKSKTAQTVSVILDGWDSWSGSNCSKEDLLYWSRYDQQYKVPGKGLMWGAASRTLPIGRFWHVAKFGWISSIHWDFRFFRLMAQSTYLSPSYCFVEIIFLGQCFAFPFWTFFLLFKFYPIGSANVNGWCLDSDRNTFSFLGPTISFDGCKNFNSGPGRLARH